VLCGGANTKKRPCSGTTGREMRKKRRALFNGGIHLVNTRAFSARVATKSAPRYFIISIILLAPFEPRARRTTRCCIVGAGMVLA